jgi:hypothetical protein
MIINYHLHCSFSDMDTEQDFIPLYSAAVDEMTDQLLGTKLAHLAGYECHQLGSSYGRIAMPMNDVAGSPITPYEGTRAFLNIPKTLTPLMLCPSRNPGVSSKYTCNACP